MNQGFYHGSVSVVLSSWGKDMSVVCIPTHSPSAVPYLNQPVSSVPKEQQLKLEVARTLEKPEAASCSRLLSQTGV